MKAVNVVIGINGVNYVAMAVPVHPLATPCSFRALVAEQLEHSKLCSTWMYMYV